MKTNLPNLKKNIEIFEKNKIQILQIWIKNKSVLSILNNYSIRKETFIKDYAFGILDYYIGVIKETNEIGNCPVIQKFLIFLKDKNVGTNELFMICAGFKNALIEFIFDKNINSLEIQKEIIYVYEKNFEGVLKQYSDTISKLNKDINMSSNFISTNIIMSSTDKNGIITSVSKAFCKISGYSEKELLGKNHNIVRHPGMSKKRFSDLWSTISSGNIWKGEIKNLKKDGNFYWVLATIVPDFDKNTKKIIGYSAVRHNITSKKQVETQQELLVDQSRSTAMGEMIAMLAHQWRQPLQATSMLIQQLTLEKMIDGQVSDETLESVTTNTKKQLEYMSKTIDDFRDYFNPDKNKEIIKVHNLIDKARDLIAYTLKSDDISFKIDIKDNIEILVHINEIVQVLINIIKNSRDALIKINHDNKLISIISYKNNSNIIMEISDNAGGIPENILGQIFDPYFSTKKNKNGTGLGLYMSKSIIEKQGDGILSVRNKNSGAMFSIALPIK
jgi:PAS domain S-box-containing protein